MEAAAKAAAEARESAKSGFVEVGGKAQSATAVSSVIGRSAARATADEAAFRAERADEAARRARSERLAVERAVRKRSAEMEAALLRTGAAHAARAALTDAKVAAAKEAAQRATIGKRAAEALVQELEGSVGAQKRCVSAEWDAAEAASQAHAIATEKAAEAAQRAAIAKGKANVAADHARLRREEATSAAEHAYDLEREAEKAHAEAVGLLQPNEESEHQAAMRVLRARKMAQAQAKAAIDEAGRKYVAASAHANAAANAAKATERAIVAAQERPTHWFSTVDPAAVGISVGGR